jgi:hypothetical protein
MYYTYMENLTETMTDLKIATAVAMLHREILGQPGCTYTGSNEDHAELYEQLKYIAYDLLPETADADDICNLWYEIQADQAAAALSPEHAY